SCRPGLIFRCLVSLPEPWIWRIMTSVVERNIGKSPRAGVRLLKQVAVCRLRRHLLITLALVASFVLLSVCHVLAESDAVDWRTLIEQYKSREGLTVEERFKLAIAY